MGKDSGEVIINRREFFGWTSRLLAMLPFITLAEPFAPDNEIIAVGLPDSEIGNSSAVMSLIQTFKPPSNVWVFLYDPTEFYRGPRKPNGYIPLYDTRREHPGFYFPYSGDTEWVNEANGMLNMAAHQRAEGVIETWRGGVLFSYEARLRAERLGAKVLTGYFESEEIT